MITTLKNITLEQLKQDYPDVCKSIKEEIIRQAVLQDRARGLLICRYYNANLKGKGLESILYKAIEDGTSLGVFQQAAEAVAKDKLTTEIKEVEFSKLTHLEKAKIYQNQKGCSMMEALRATAQRR